MSQRKQSDWGKKNSGQWKNPSYDVSGKKDIEIKQVQLSIEEIRELLKRLEKISMEMEDDFRQSQ